jgi:Tfp pilus assembly protein PilO
MKTVFRVCALVTLVACLAGFAFQQSTTVPRPARRPAEEEEVILPSGKSQKDEILKAEYAQNLKDAADLSDLAQQLKLDLEKNDRYVVSMATIKKTDDIEKLAKRIRARLRH